MTKLELANELIKQLQEQSSSKLDMIDKLQQQVQVQQTWFQWAVGIFISIAAIIAGLTWASVRAESKRSREEFDKLKNELGINELSELVDRQRGALDAMAKESKKYKRESDIAKNMIDSLKQQLVKQNENQLVIAGIGLQTISLDSPVELLKGIANVELVIALPNINKVDRFKLVEFIRILIKFWDNFQQNSSQFQKEYIGVVVGMLNRTKDIVLNNPRITGQLYDDYMGMLNEAINMECELK